MQIIQSERLDLISINPQTMQAFVEGDIELASQIAGFQVPPEADMPVGALKMWIRQLGKDPSLQPWLIRAIVLREKNLMVGNIGFHTKPDPPYLAELAPGGVEFGYGVFASYRRQGFAKEAAAALMEWAQLTAQIGVFILSISPTNLPSTKMALSMGFEKFSSHIDPLDGPEDIYRYVIE